MTGVLSLCRFILAVAILLVLAFLPASVAVVRADIIVSNGTFLPEQPDFATIYAVSNAIPGWTVATGSVDWIGSYWQGAGGGYSIDMDGNNPGSISQNLTTVSGQGYTLTFDLSGNPGGGNPLKTLDVSADSTAQNFTYTTGSNTNSNMQYVSETLYFQATGSKRS